VIFKINATKNFKTIHSLQPQKVTPSTKARHTMYRSLRLVCPFLLHSSSFYPTPKSLFFTMLFNQTDTPKVDRTARHGVGTGDSWRLVQILPTPLPLTTHHKSPVCTSPQLGPLDLRVLRSTMSQTRLNNTAMILHCHKKILKTLNRIKFISSCPVRHNAFALCDSADLKNELLL